MARSTTPSFAFTPNLVGACVLSFHLCRAPAITPVGICFHAPVGVAQEEGSHSIILFSFSTRIAETCLCCRLTSCVIVIACALDILLCARRGCRHSRRSKRRERGVSGKRSCYWGGASCWPARWVCSTNPSTREQMKSSERNTLPSPRIPPLTHCPDRIESIGNTFLSYLWQRRKERLAIGDRPCGTKSTRGLVIKCYNN